MMETLSKMRVWRSHARPQLPAFYKAILVVLLILSGHDASAQATGMVRGRVLDESGKGVVDATVSIVRPATGTNFTTRSGNDGGFNFQNLENGAEYEIRASHIGFDTRVISRFVIKPNDFNSIVIRLSPLASNLNEVVVLGYTSQRRRDITSAVSSLKRSDYASQPYTNIQAVLQGRLSGVAVNTNNGAPGAPVKVRIRGANSINGGNEPLYVVDGITLTGIGLQDLNPADIETIDVLKDAASTAIYGSRGANGVVVITTRRSPANSTRISYDGTVSFNKLGKTYDVLSGPEYAAQANQIAGATIFKDPANAVTTDWQRLVFRNSVTQQHNLSLSSAGQNYNIFSSANFSDLPGIVINSSYRKYGFRTNARLTVSPKFDVTTSIYLSRSEALNNNDIGKSNMVSGALAWGPAETPYDDAGKYRRYSVSAIWNNPLLLAKEQQNRTFTNSLFATAMLRYRFTEWLTLTANFGIDANTYKTAFLNNDWISPGNAGSGQGITENNTFQNNEILTFQKRVNDDHFIKVSAIGEVTTNTIQGFSARGSGLTTTNLGYYNLGLNTSKDISGAYSHWALLSYVTRAEYSYKDKLLLNASFRADGASKFKKKWGYFPSVGVGYNVFDESKNENTPLLSSLKLRASWGLTGNQSIMPYSSLGVLTGMQYSFGTPTLYQGYAPGNPPADLQWEKTRQADVGLDLGISNRVRISADYYNKLTRDLLLQVPVPYYNGGGYIFQNIGKVRNTGAELSVDGVAIANKNFRWNTGLNVSYNSNEVISLGKDSLLYRPIIGGGIVNTAIQVIRVGQPMSSFYLIPWEGIYNTGNAALGYRPGDNKYRDVSGNGNIGYDDRALAGNALPKVTFGFTNQLTYKGLEMNIFIQGSYGNKIYNGVYAANGAPTSEIKYPTLRDSYSFWTEVNTNAQWANPASRTNRNYVESTKYLQDGGYLRLKNVSLSYTLPRSLIKFGDVKLNISAQNMLTITKYKGYDPEASSTPLSSDADGGIDFGAYPLPKTISVGLNVTL